MSQSRIDVKDPQDLRDWCQKLRASEEELRRAVDQVGPSNFVTAGPTS